MTVNLISVDDLIQSPAKPCRGGWSKRPRHSFLLQRRCEVFRGRRSLRPGRGHKLIRKPARQAGLFRGFSVNSPVLVLNHIAGRDRQPLELP
jgi:hypothetical protein